MADGEAPPRPLGNDEAMLANQALWDIWTGIHKTAGPRRWLANCQLSTLCAFGTFGASAWPGGRTTYAQRRPRRAFCEPGSDRKRA